MFFLGGINSVLPYLLYLSLIWIFLIIGLHGKMIAVWHTLNPAGQHTVSVSEQEQLFADAYDYRQNTPPGVGKIMIQQTPWRLAAFPESTPLFNHYCPSPCPLHVCMETLTFRGPPFLHS